ncbi:DUF3883 domain-containing protein [Aurantimonas sp. 22II-16-19i]|uniref:DUF3883 domain-containing protein n=1 Tax=Aurantimonas sp. 22II-16-19i TaxID=1317114 RepID=UPI0009F7DB00|nr:DUF3883 domain-containing protein [Aurantimonas sp. 22II-16-19i]ORE97751.1 hypothetical protein ATO4_07425 [Aurantimonas sp. 22II-16-19i]
MTDVASGEEDEKEVPSKNGTDWSDEDNDFLVETYLRMMRLEHDRVDFIKSHIRQEAQDRLERTKRSVELKLMNVSAVLSELGFTHLTGYARKMNFQQSLFAAIERRLAGYPADLEFLENFSPRSDRPSPKPGRKADATSFDVVEPIPPLRNASAEQMEALSRLVRKFDPAARDAKNRILGLRGEQFVFDFEQQNMIAEGRRDLLSEVRWVSRDEGDGHGYDIVSVDPQTEKKKFIEVKSTRGSQYVPFFLSRNEIEVGERTEGWQIYRVFDIGTRSRLFKLRPPLDACTRMRPETMKVWPFSTLESSRSMPDA